MAGFCRVLMLRPLTRLESCAAARLGLCETSSVNVSLERNVNIYAYTNKNKRRIKESRSSKNREWAELLRKTNEDLEALESVPAEEPHMLHVVYLIKPTFGRPWWEKDIIKRLGLEGKLHRPVILKNVPSVNKQLYEVKHLLKMLPLKFPHGLPEDESDFKHAVVKSNGEMVVVKRLKEYEPEAEPVKNKWDLEIDVLKEDLAKKIINYNVHTEYHKTSHTYKLNQDGKEYRYNFNKDVPKYEW